METPIRLSIDTGLDCPEAVKVRKVGVLAILFHFCHSFLVITVI